MKYLRNRNNQVYEPIWIKPVSKQNYTASSAHH